MYRTLLPLLLGALCISALIGCSNAEADPQRPTGSTNPVIHVLGTMQDGGAPHIGCNRPCCRNLFLRPATERKVVCLGVTDADASGQPVGALIEATPDFPAQLHDFQSAWDVPLERLSVFLTHAHIGHYSGLMFLGREALGAKGIKTWVMPRFMAFLANNGPWSQLVQLGNIELHLLEAEKAVPLGKSVTITPLLVPHRDEFSETVGFRIVGPAKSALFIPDINKWELWDRKLEEVLAEVDYAFLDATFYDAAEVGHRDMAEIPHPFMVETMDRLQALPSVEKAKIRFIHFNHTNPCLDTTSNAFQRVVEAGFRIAQFGETVSI